MDPENQIDRNLLWIAKNGLMEPVPQPWQAFKDYNDNIIYYNTITEERTHKHPMNFHYRNLCLHVREKLLSANEDLRN